MPDVTTGNPADSASTKLIPKPSAVMLGWQNRSAAFNTVGISERWPRNRTRLEMPRRFAEARNESR